MRSWILARMDVSAMGRYDDNWSLGLPGLSIGMTVSYTHLDVYKRQF